jgi:hypothetical protein
MQHCRQNHGAEQREHTAGEVPQRTTLIYFWRWLVANVCLLPKKYRNGEQGSNPRTGGTFNSETALAATSRDSSERSMKRKASKSEANSCSAPGDFPIASSATVMQSSPRTSQTPRERAKHTRTFLDRSMQIRPSFGRTICGSALQMVETHVTSTMASRVRRRVFA